MLNSRIAIGKHVPLAAYAGERVYMQPFMQKEGLPKNLTRWQNTVDAMLDGIETSLPIYLMIDQGIVEPNTYHRRSGLHVDGFWCAGHEHDRHNRISTHGGSGHVSTSIRPSHGGGGHSTKASHDNHRPTKHGGGGAKETLLLVSNRVGCVGYEGTFEHPEWKMGDRSAIDVSKFKKVVFEPHRVYGGDTMSMLHESIPIGQKCERTVVRLNVPGVSLWENIH